jgi:glutaredoxin-like YruB-family protein
MAKVSIYSTPTCHFCGLAKDFLKEHNIPYTEYNVATDLERRQEMKTLSGQMGVPVINVDGKIIVGYDEATLAKAVGV